jgi:hypothetical protein
MSNKRQSALDWYIQEIDKYNKEPWKYVTKGNKQAIIEQAKEKQRQQLDHAFINGKFVYMDSDETSQQYYEENYEQ